MSVYRTIGPLVCNCIQVGFVSDLVGNPEDCFSRVTAHVMLEYNEADIRSILDNLE